LIAMLCDFVGEEVKLRDRQIAAPLVQSSRRFDPGSRVDR